MSLGNLFNRLVFSLVYGERNILFNGSINENSKIIYVRNPADRVEAVAPWLTLDTDPYPAVVDGRVTWIVDGYTTLENYPYAERMSLGDATADGAARARRGCPTRTVSYLRNSVKATVDAYDGTVTLYAFDESDPVLQTWSKAFPGAVQPASAISDSLRAHFRYPEDLFKVQRELLTEYHVDERRRVLLDRVVLGRAVRPDGAGRGDRGGDRDGAAAVLRAGRAAATSRAPRSSSPARW